MSYDSYLHEKTSDTRDTVKRVESMINDRRDSGDRERIRRYISFLKADRATMVFFNWEKDGAQFIPQIIHDLCEVEAFLKIYRDRIAWRPGLEFNDLIELFMSVCKDFLTLAEGYKGYLGYCSCTVEDFIKEWEES